jgi:ABC-type antimicrobial peptide transport system permease subunit
VAVFLTLVGLYGLIAFAVRQRTAEIGVRMALGATPGAMIRMVILSGLKLTFAGLAIGVCSALALARGMATFIYGIPAIDPVTFLGVPAFMLAITFIACIFPAWKAAQIDPVDALRQQ